MAAPVLGSSIPASGPTAGDRSQQGRAAARNVSQHEAGRRLPRDTQQDGCALAWHSLIASLVAGFVAQRHQELVDLGQQFVGFLADGVGGFLHLAA